MKKFVKLIGRINKAFMVSLLFVVLVAMLGLPYWLWYQLWLYDKVFASAALGFLFWLGFVAYLFEIPDDKQDNEEEEWDREEWGKIRFPNNPKSKE